jgi:hypothetical protein
MVETDLRLSISEGHDQLVVSGLATAGTLLAGTAGDAIVKVRRGISQLANAGYAADTLIIDAAGAEELDLMTTSGDEAMYMWGPGSFAGVLFGLNRRVTKQAGTAVVDSDAFGRLYASPLSLQRFEVDAGLTNRSNHRLEVRHVRGRADHRRRANHVIEVKLSEHANQHIDHDRQADRQHQGYHQTAGHETNLRPLARPLGEQKHPLSVVPVRHRRMTVVCRT